MSGALRICAVIALALWLPVVAGAQELQGTLKKIKDSGTMTIGYREQSVPFSFKGPDGKPAGYSVDLCQRIATGVQQQLKMSKLDVKWVPVTPENRISSVVNGTIDLECGSTTNSLSRQEQVDFSNMTWVDGAGLLVRSGQTVTGLADMGGKRIAVIPGTTTEKALSDELRKRSVSAQLVPVKDHDEGRDAVLTSKVDGYASDRVLLIGLLLTSKESSKLALADDSHAPHWWTLASPENHGVDIAAWPDVEGDDDHQDPADP